MIALSITALVGLALGAYTGYGVGYNRAVDRYADEAIGAAEARRARDHRGAGRWQWLAVGAFVVAMLALGAATR